SPKDDGVHWVERSSTYAYAGSFSCRASGFFYESATVSVVDSFNKEFTALNLSFKPSLVSGRRYILKARIRTEQNAWPNRNGETLYFNFYTGAGSYPITNVVRQYRTHDQIEDSWQEISL